MAKNIFIAATDKDVGKSTVSFAFLKRLTEMNKDVSFIKPVGQRWVASKWGPVDEDVVLMKETFGLGEEPVDMNPVVVGKGFTEEYLLRSIKPDLTSKIIESYKKIAKEKDYVVIEGTGHAGVGSVFDHSNADIAALLNAKVILVAKGGIGNTIDRLELNRVYFESKGVDVIGVVVNKVIEKKLEKVRRALSIYCEKKGLALLGVIPYSAVLNNPTLDTIIEEIKPKIIQEEVKRNLVVDNFIVGAASIEEALYYISRHKGNVMLIFPSDRVDVIFAISKMQDIISQWNSKISAVLMNGSRMPSEMSIQALVKEELTVLWKKGDTFSTVSRLSAISVKTRSGDEMKIEVIKDVVFRNIDFKKAISRLASSDLQEQNIGRVLRAVRRFFRFIFHLFSHDIAKIFRRK